MTIKAQKFELCGFFEVKLIYDTYEEANETSMLF